MTQTLLTFDLHRATDPQTSRESAADIAPKLNGLRAAMLTVLRECGPMTASEAAQECVRRFGGLAESYRKRATECVRLGFAEAIEPRPCGVTGKLATVYRVRG